MPARYPCSSATPLSDLIGFSYASRDREARTTPRPLSAVGGTGIRERLAGIPTVSIILDGENAWSTFREGAGVLRKVYGASRGIGKQGVTRRAIAQEPRRSSPAFAGSWIQPDFSCGSARDDGGRDHWLRAHASARIAQKSEDPARALEEYRRRGELGGGTATILNRTTTSSRRLSPPTARGVRGIGECRAPTTESSPPATTRCARAVRGCGLHPVDGEISGGRMGRAGSPCRAMGSMHRSTTACARCTSARGRAHVRAG